MLRSFLCFIVVFVSFQVKAQFWFGPILGVSHVSRNYEDKNWKGGSYGISNTIAAHYGGVMNYTTHETFSVHVEAYVQRLKNTVRNLPGAENLIISNTAFTTINVPFLLRYRMPFNQYMSGYLNFGPRLTYWISGSGDLSTDDDIFAQRGFETIEYKIRFSGDPEGSTRMVLESPRRLKYALEFGGGFYIDLINHKRIMFDARYSIGHSFMAFNEGSTEFFPLDNGYFENFEYQTNMLQFSISYLFGFDPIDSRRGRSTSKTK